MGANATKLIQSTKGKSYRLHGKPQKSFRWRFKKRYQKIGFHEEVASSLRSLFIEETGINTTKYHKHEQEPAGVRIDINHFPEVYGSTYVSAGSSEADVQERETAESGNVKHNAAECRSSDVSSSTSEVNVNSTCSSDLTCIEQAYLNREEMLSSPDSAVDADLSADSCSSTEDCSLCNAANIEYMVKTFADFLQNNLNINEILPYLHFIADSDAMMMKAIIPQSRAVKHLIYVIMHRTDDKGKWVTFLMALDRTGHKYAYQLLRGETEKDHFYSSKLLKIMKPELINQICLGEIIDPLYERELINDEDKAEVESAEKNKGPFEATRILLNKVDKKSPNWDTEFADVLEKAGMAEIADIFKMVEHHTHNDENDICTNHCNSKQAIRQRSNRKFKKGKRRCRLHGQSKSHATTVSLEEPGIKRLRTHGYPFCIGLNEEAGIDLKIHEMKNVVTEMQTANTSYTVMQKDLLDKIDVLKAQSTKSADEQALMKRQIGELNHMINCMNETLTKLLSYQEDRELEKDSQVKDVVMMGQSSRARIRRWRVQ